MCSRDKRSIPKKNEQIALHQAMPEKHINGQERENMREARQDQSAAAAVVHDTATSMSIGKSNRRSHGHVKADKNMTEPQVDLPQCMEATAKEGEGDGARKDAAGLIITNFL